mmetsp:Transcript_21759/g.39977  ORF Transcript_21759/g.39977 Transcript_21759/m.39977 type:complete len:961 (+) Transcript_21759:247-3129(+)
MNFYPATAIQVPTKKEFPSSGERRVVGACGDAAAGGAPGGGGPSNRNIRGNSSSSSLNVASNIFSSMRELEASGRNVSSLGTLSALSQVGIRGAPLPASSALESALGGSMGSSGGMVMGAGGATVGLHSSLNGIMGVGGHPHTESLVAAQRDRLNALAAGSFAGTGRSNGTTPLPMEDMLYSNPMAAGGGDGRSAYSSASIQAQAQALRQLEMEEIMRQHQHQNQNAATSNNNHYYEQNQQRTNLLGNLKGGYAPMQSPTHRRGSDNISGALSISSPMQSSTSQHNPSILDNSLLDTFTPAELLREVSRRQSQRRNSRDMLAGMDQGSVMDALSRNNSRDDLVDLYNQMRHRGSSTGLRANSLANSLDSFSSLALMARQREGGAMSGMPAAASAIPHHGAQHRDGGAMPALSLPPRRLSETNNDASSSDASDDQQQRQQRRGSYSKNESLDVVSVPTAKTSSSSKTTCDKTTSEAEESSSDATNSTVVTNTQSPRPSAAASATAIDGSRENKKLSGRKRSNSNASFDALLSVFGDELAKLDREKNGGSKTNNKNGQMEDDDKSADSIVSGASVGFFNKLIKKTAAATVARQNEEEEKNDAMDMKENAAVQDKRRHSTSSSLSDYPRLSHADESRDSSSISQEHPPAAMNNDRVLSHMDNLLDRERQRTIALPPSRDLSSFLPINTTFANNATSPGTSNYTRKIQSTTSMMASLEAMRHKELVMRERALREAALRDLQAQRATLGAPPPPPNPNIRMAAPPPILPRGGDPKMGPLAALFGGHLPPGVMGSAGAGGPSSSVRHSEAAAAANAMLARLQGFPPEYPRPELLPNHNQQVLALPVPHVPVIIEKPHPAIDPNHIPPEVALQRFLDEYGEAAKTSQTDLLGSIAKAEESLASIHAWDRSQGLRKCHSRTVVKTRRSRAKVKAFLMGIDPPKEPQKKRKKTKKKAKVVVDKEIVVSM